MSYKNAYIFIDDKISYNYCMKQKIKVLAYIFRNKRRSLGLLFQRGV